MPSPYRTNEGERWRALWRDDNHRQRSRGAFHTREEAAEYERQRAEERRLGRLGRDTKARETELQDWVKEWWALHVSELPGNTRKSYARAINHLVYPYIGRVPMADLDTPRIAEWRDELVKASYSSHQVTEAMRVLSSCLGKAVERGYLDLNPVRDASKPKKPPKKLIVPMSPLEVEWTRLAMLTYEAGQHGPLEALRSATMTDLMAYGGLRPSEIAGLKKAHVDFESGGIWIRDVYADEHREDDTKTHRGRFVDLYQPIMEDLKLWVDVAPPGRNGHDWLFPDANGGMSNLTMKNWRRPYGRAVTHAVAAHPELADTVGKSTPYTLRHTTVSVEVRAGNTSLADLADRMGHTVKTMIENYTHVVRALKRQPPTPVEKQLARARANAGTPQATRKLHEQITGEITGRHGLVDFASERAKRRAS